MMQDGRTPLHWAAAGENLAIVQLLLTHEPEIDAKDQSGWTALMIAGETFIVMTHAFDCL